MKKIYFAIIYGAVILSLIGGVSFYIFLMPGGPAEQAQANFDLTQTLDQALDKFDTGSYYMDRESESTYLDRRKDRTEKTVKQLSVADSPYQGKLYESYDDMEFTHYFNEDTLYLEDEDGALETINDSKAKSYIDSYTGIASFKDLLKLMAENEDQLTKEKAEGGYQFSIKATGDMAYELVDALYYAQSDEHYDKTIGVDSCRVSFVIDPRTKTIQRIDMKVRLDQDSAYSGDLIRFEQTAVFSNYGKVRVQFPEKVKDQDRKTAV